MLAMAAIVAVAAPVAQPGTAAAAGTALPRHVFAPCFET
jgi:hypothetical protein